MMAVSIGVASCSGGKAESPREEQSKAGATPLRLPSTGTQKVEVGAMVEIRKSWAKVYEKPQTASRPLGLAYGNDAYEVVAVEGEWVQIKYKNNRAGWITYDSTQH